jgi:4-aminobutyrate aminotransferase-like enzyme
LLFDPLFSTEGLLRLPAGYISALADMVHAAGGLVIADEVQSGFGRSGTHFWGFELVHTSPDIVTLGKPMGNGHPLGAAVTTAALNDEFGSANLYFNTFAGNPVSSAAGMAVLTEMTDRQLQRNARQMGTRAREILLDIANGSPYIRCVKGTGLFFGLEFSDGDGKPLTAQAKWVVEQMRRNGVLISTIGQNGNVLKIRPPMVFDDENLNTLTDRLGRAVQELAHAH